MLWRVCVEVLMSTAFNIDFESLARQEAFVTDLSCRYPRDLLAPDLQLVSNAASKLHVREFDLFRAAWQNWFEQSPDDKVLERHFVNYLFHQHVPFWVRHYARGVVRDAKTGQGKRRDWELAV